MTLTLAALRHRISCATFVYGYSKKKLKSPVKFMIVQECRTCQMSQFWMKVPTLSISNYILSHPASEKGSGACRRTVHVVHSPEYRLRGNAQRLLSLKTVWGKHQTTEIVINALTPSHWKNTTNRSTYALCLIAKQAAVLVANGITWRKTTIVSYLQLL